MKTTVIALHGFLGKGSDWDDVRIASKADATWICPDLFACDGSSFSPPDVEGPCWLAGYSFGARLALQWMQDAPAKWLGALLVSANPGNFQSEDERAARRVSDEAWALRFRGEAWHGLMNAWDAQNIFSGRPGPLRAESDFDRDKLAEAIVEFSVSDQFTDPLRLPSRMVWLAGAQDMKFSALLDRMRDAGFPGSFLRIDDAGHRVLSDAPRAVADALDNLVA